MKRTIGLILASLACVAPSCFSDTTINATNRHAYGANIGWIAFEAGGNPRVDLLTGRLSGYAYGANVGWISLSNSSAFVQTDRLGAGPDSDGDGLPDAWEYAMTGRLTNLGSGSADWDRDGITDAGEYAADTDPMAGASVLEITAVTRQGPTNRVTWTVEPTRLYRLEQSQSLTNGAPWTDSGLGILPPGSGTTLTGAVPAPASTALFYRAKALVPLSP